MSEEKARAQAMRFQDTAAIIEVLDDAYDEGIRTFMCTTHDRIAEVCDHLRANRGTIPGLQFYPCMPYAHKYANAVTELGVLGAIRAFCRRRTSSARCIRGGMSLARKDVEGLTTLLIDAEMKMFAGLQHAGDLPAERGDGPSARPGLRRGLPDLRRPRARALRRRARLHHDEPAAAAAALEKAGIENPIVCANINKIGFRMCGGIEAYERGDCARAVAADRHVGVRHRRHPARARPSSGSADSRTSSRSCSAPRAAATSRKRSS